MKELTHHESAPKNHWSKGCALCHKGDWLCVYITDACTRRCSFCAQNKTKEGFREIKAFTNREHIFNNPEELISHLSKTKTHGLGISGGEPLLELNKAVSIIKAARKKFGKRIYIWLYSNGDLLTKPIAKRLANAGLDEIRFDLAARKYNLLPIEIAYGIIPNLTIETPAFPSDEKKLLTLLPRLKRLGVKYMNLHEVMVTRENYTRLTKKPIPKKLAASEKITSLKGSLATAERILKAAKKIGIGAHSCSTRYKLTEQTALYLERIKQHK